jgi:glycosyltransferase involved in cell wall biosynthesis
MAPKYSLVISTLGRCQEVLHFISTIGEQTYAGFELIIVDQNDGTLLRDAIKAQSPSYPLIYLPCPGERGLSRGRNAGFRAASGDIICFPDDDCTYPADILEKVDAMFARHDADIICGRGADEHGGDVNGRFERSAQYVTKRNAFSTQIEWMVFFKRKVLEAVNGYDEDIGIGASTPWQAAEGQDIMMRAMAKGYRAYYSPDIYGHHMQLNICHPDKAVLKKARVYARGTGFVLGKHRFPLSLVLKNLMRPLAGGIFFLASFNFARARYYGNVILGRIEGYRDGITMEMK